MATWRLRFAVNFSATWLFPALNYLLIIMTVWMIPIGFGKPERDLEVTEEMRTEETRPEHRARSPALLPSNG